MSSQFLLFCVGWSISTATSTTKLVLQTSAKQSSTKIRQSYGHTDPEPAYWTGNDPNTKSYHAKAKACTFNICNSTTNFIYF